MSILVNDVHPAKALLPISSTLLGISMIFKDEQPEYLQLTVYQFVLFKTVEKLFRGFY